MQSGDQSTLEALISDLGQRRPIPLIPIWVALAGAAFVAWVVAHA